MTAPNEFMDRAIDLARQSGQEGNLPIGAVIALGEVIVAEGRNAIWFPHYDATRHAEIEALRAVPQQLWDRASEMTLYTTLEPCVMCFGSILLHQIGRVVFGSADPFGGARLMQAQLPQYFREQLRQTTWEGPMGQGETDGLYAQVMELVLARRDRDG